MLRRDAIEILGGGRVKATAAAVGVQPQAVSRWPETLEGVVLEKVQAALYRQALGWIADKPPVRWCAIEVRQWIEACPIGQELKEKKHGQG